MLYMPTESIEVVGEKRRTGSASSDKGGDISLHQITNS